MSTEKLDANEPNETTKAAMLEARGMTDGRYGAPEELFSHLDSLSLRVAANSASGAGWIPMPQAAPLEGWFNFDEKKEYKSRAITLFLPSEDLTELQKAADIKGVDWRAFIRETMKAKSKEIIAGSVNAGGQEVV